MNGPSIPGPARLLIVLIGGAVALWFLLPAYVRSASEISQQLRAAATHKDSDLSRYRVVRCDFDWLGNAHCRGGGR